MYLSYKWDVWFVLDLQVLVRSFGFKGVCFVLDPQILMRIFYFILGIIQLNRLLPPPPKKNLALNFSDNFLFI